MEFVKIAETSEVPVGEMKMVKLGLIGILIANVDGNYYAIRNRCTHVGGDLSTGSLNSKIVAYPWHGSKFDVKTREVVSGQKALFLRLKIRDEPSFQVKVDEKDISVKTS